LSFPLATIDAAALRHNLGVVRRLAPNSRVLAVIKADAYGHGMVGSAKALVDAHAFGVARLHEALALRSAGITHAIVLLEGAASAEQVAQARAHDFELVVHSFEQLSMLEQCAHDAAFIVWLKVDTGMNRLGFRPEEFSSALSRLQACKAVRAVRLMTHLASADATDRSMTDQQLMSFKSLTSDLKLEKSIANSAGLIGSPEARVEWVRPGLMLYGASPLGEDSARELGLRPAMTLSTSLIAVRNVRVGEAVGYAGIWRAQRDARIGIAAIGYGDGYPRGMRSGAPVLVGAHYALIAGRVSMDMIAIDITDLPDANVGSEVTLWGRGLPVERVAPFADTIAYELLCRVNERVAVNWEN
jgi:alanine racemase